MPEPIFVFGSNLQGIHGAGAALHARKHRGAIKGIGEGPMGTSYALPTKITPYETMPLAELQEHVATFLEFALGHPELQFQLTPIGCGLAGYTPEEIAPMFEAAPSNVLLPEQFAAVLDR